MKVHFCPSNKLLVFIKLQNRRDMKCMKGNNNLLQLGRYVPSSTVSCRNLQLRLLQHHSVLFITVVNYMQLITQELFAYLCYPWLILRDSPCLARAHLIEKSYFEPIVCFWNCRQFWNWNSKKNWFREIKKNSPFHENVNQTSSSSSTLEDFDRLKITLPTFATKLFHYSLKDTHTTPY